MRFAALAIVLLSFGCRRATQVGTDAAPPTTATESTQSTAQTTDPFGAPPRELPAAEAPRDNVTFDTGTTYKPGEPVAIAPQEDPFDATVASVRGAAVGCFASLPPGEYNASIAVTVTPSGTATRVEVTAGPDDAAVRKCLESAATRAYPSSPDGRKLAIVVQVKG